MASVQQFLDYLHTKHFNTPRETAHDLHLTEIELDALIVEVETTTQYYVYKGIRRESYGHEVLWLKHGNTE